jgi:hypothetical protein
VIDSEQPPPASAGEPALEPEWLDRPGLSSDDRRRGISDLRRVNRFLFGHGAVIRTVLAELRGARGPQLLLDVASGSGDGAAAVGRAVERRGMPARIVALDRELAHLALGRELGEIDLAVVADAGSLPFRDAAFDLVLSSLFFHHLDPAGKSSVVAEMTRVSRRSAVIVDLVPSRWALLALRTLFPLLGIGRIAREDGEVSIRRGWSAEQWRRFLGAAPAEVRRRFPARVAVVLRGASGSDRSAPPDRGSRPQSR